MTDVDLTRAGRTVTVKVRRWGREVAFVVPGPVAEELRLRPGVLVDVRLRKRR
jgi:antitoxin component of MazEF toxin-antitoxin module